MNIRPNPIHGDGEVCTYEDGDVWIVVFKNGDISIFCAYCIKAITIYAKSEHNVDIPIPEEIEHIWSET